ncbi:hypothetical protein KAJ83_06010 [Marivibrio halodurans]|uniref:Uncharacterized protein n=1 Tax=Marivibrio halodurans TaxID=2039722 RepID=A0A8J7SHP2_9PROT|nr:hypothetical protein [Marivibrio halodurans]MBP5856553.1 hypothetical protein [Marivibrio halodurans]
MTHEDERTVVPHAPQSGANRNAGHGGSVEAAAFWALGALLLAGALIAAALQISQARQSEAPFDGLAGGGFCAAAGLGARDFLLGAPARTEQIDQTPVPR